MRSIALIHLLAICSFLVQAQSDKRIALVIGVQNYSTLPPLRNSLNDAKAMAEALRGKGFHVESLFDPQTKREIRDAITRYYEAMRDQKGATGIIFYAGHGMQYEGDNYIIPATARLQDPGDLGENCVQMNSVMAVLKSTNESLNILLLDACRSLPSFTRGSEQGLTRMDAPQGSIIVFATQPGKLASDGTGTHGLFTAKMLEVMNEPNLNITDVFKKVKQEVFQESESNQLPSVEDNSIGGDFFFTPATKSTSINSSSKKDATAKPVILSIPVKKELSDADKKEALRQEKHVKEKATVEPKNAIPPPVKMIAKTVPAVDFGYGPTTKAIAIGNQIWSTVNLNVDHFANGVSIATEQDGFKWWDIAKKMQPEWCYYNNEIARESKYGKLYNWYAVADPRGLCPTGWHVPSHDEFKELTALLGHDAGKLLKADDTWSDDPRTGGPGTGSDDLGFTAYPTGKRMMLGTYEPMGDMTGWWWTSTIDTESVMPTKYAWSMSLHSWTNEAEHMSNAVDNGAAVRCLKD